jgi:hypothetical protein
VTGGQLKGKGGGGGAGWSWWPIDGLVSSAWTLRRLWKSTGEWAQPGLNIFLIFKISSNLQIQIQCLPEVKKYSNFA